MFMLNPPPKKKRKKSASLIKHFICVAIFRKCNAYVKQYSLNDLDYKVCLCAHQGNFLAEAMEYVYFAYMSDFLTKVWADTYISHSGLSIFEFWVGNSNLFISITTDFF